LRQNWYLAHTPDASSLFEVLFRTPSFFGYLIGCATSLLVPNRPASSHPRHTRAQGLKKRGSFLGAPKFVNAFRNPPLLRRGDKRPCKSPIVGALLPSPVRFRTFLPDVSLAAHLERPPLRQTFLLEKGLFKGASRFLPPTFLRHFSLNGRLLGWGLSFAFVATLFDFLFFLGAIGSFYHYKQADGDEPRRGKGPKTGYASEVISGGLRSVFVR